MSRTGSGDNLYPEMDLPTNSQRDNVLLHSISLARMDEKKIGSWGR